MTLLLDTHALLWWLDDPQLLSKAARKAITDGKNTVYVSAAVVWEIAIKRSLGELVSPHDLEGAMASNRFLPLPVTIPHALAFEMLPWSPPRPVRPSAHCSGSVRGIQACEPRLPRPTLWCAPYRRVTPY